MGLKSTQVLLKKIIRLVIETGTVTGMRLYSSCDITNEKPITFAAVIAVMILVLSVLPGHPTYFTTPAGILAKVYSNSMMVVLNNRMQIADPETNTTATHLRLDNGTDGYELGQGVLATREEMIFPCDPDKVDGTSSQMNKSSHVV